jgi:hypothetical protein
VTTTPAGVLKPAIVAVTVLDTVSITDIVSPLALVTYTLNPSGATAIPCGYVPTLTVALTVLLVVSITDTVPESLFVT